MFKDLFSAPKSAPPVSAEIAPATSSRHSETVLSAECAIRGVLTTRGHIRIEGAFTGDVTADGRVTLGNQASLDGDVIGETVTVGGIVRGNITARQVAILRTGRVWGDLRLERLSTEEGGFMQGQVMMEEQVDIASAIAGGGLDEASVEIEAAEEATQAPPEQKKEPVPVPIPTGNGNKTLSRIPRTNR